MGLILPQKVDITLNNSVIRWYEDKGYEIPRYYNKANSKYMVKNGTKITVKVEDLSKGSNTKVYVECDGCHKKYKERYITYYNHNHNGKVYCIHCTKTLFFSGKNHPNWNFEKTQEEREIDRTFPEYHEFIKKVLARDNFTCQCCGKKISGDIEVHHLDGYDWCKEKRTDETNGIALCKNCHKNFHNNYGLGGNTKEQFEEWIGKRDIILQTYNGEIPKARWAYCINDNEIIKNIVDYCKKNNLLNYYIYCCCNGKCFTAYKKVYLWYDEYILLSKEELDGIIQYRMSKSRNKISNSQIIKEGNK